MLKTIWKRIASALSWQNLGEEGSVPWHGRAWLHLTEETTITLSWHLGSDFTHARVRVDGNSAEVDTSVAVPLAAFWAGVQSKALYPFVRDLGERTFGLSVHDGAVWWNLGMDENGPFRSDTPRWRHGNFNVLDALFGEPVRTVESTETSRVEIPLPEGNYQANVRTERVRFARPVLGFIGIAETFSTAQVTPFPSIPVPGKGENSWDIEQDTWSSIGVDAGPSPKIVGAVVTKVLERRLRYGGQGWRPEIKATVPPSPAAPPPVSVASAPN